MAGENLKQFEALKETSKNSLSEQEKSNLNKVSERDYRQALSKVENQKFTINWKEVLLKTIVENLTFSKDGKTAYLDWKAIEPISELWAALQVLVIANDFSVWTAKIDWTVWKDTIAWLQNLRNKYLAEGSKEDTPTKPTTPEVNPDEFKVQTVDQLINTAIYRGYVGEYENGYNLLNKDWTLKEVKKINDKITIIYKSPINGKEQAISIDASKCKKWRLYSVDDFWKAIENAITQNERNLWNDKLKREAEEKENNENDSIKEWIKNFNENTISKKFIKDYLQDIKYVNYSHQLFTIKNSRDWKEKQIHRNALLTNGKFDGVKFRQRLEMVYEQDAKNYNVKSWINDFKETSIGNKVVQWYFKEKRLNITCSKVWIAEITVRDNLGKSKPFLRQDIVWNDGLFNAQNYENKLVELYEAAAIEHYKTTFETRENRIKSTIITDLDSAKTYSQQCDGIIKDISLINSENYTVLNDIKTRVTELKQNAENDKKRFEQEQKNNNEYENFKKQMDKDLSIIKSKAGKKLSAIDMQQAKEDCLNLLRKYINITPVSGKYDTYKQESLKNDANKFIKVNKKQEYLDKVKEMKDYIGYFGVHFE